MDSLPLPRRAYYGYLSRMYAFMHALSTRSVLGIRLKSLVRWLPILALLIGWLFNWPLPVMIGLLTFIVWINYSLWRARRDNYSRFVADGAAPAGERDAQSLAPNQKVSVLATGLFSVSGRENRLLLSPAQYWRVPLGEHVIMAEEAPGKYLYQFFDSTSLQEAREGWLLFGTHPRPSLAVSFLARWGPEYTRFGPAGESGGGDLPPPKRLTIYLSIDDKATRHLLRDTIVSEARRARLELAARE